MADKADELILAYQYRGLCVDEQHAILNIVVNKLEADFSDLIDELGFGV